MRSEEIEDKSPNNQSQIKNLDEDSLTPVEKPDQGNVENPKTSLFNFDINKTVDSVKDLTGKVEYYQIQ